MDLIESAERLVACAKGGVVGGEDRVDGMVMVACRVPAGPTVVVELRIELINKLVQWGESSMGTD